MHVNDDMYSLVLRVHVELVTVHQLLLFHLSLTLLSLLARDGGIPTVVPPLTPA